MAEGKKMLKYGPISGGWAGRKATPAITQFFSDVGGHFVYKAVTDTNVTLCTQTDTNILGWLETEKLNSSLGSEVRKIIDDPTAVFCLPIAGSATFSENMKGLSCDLVVSGGIQKAAINSHATGVLIIEDGDLVNSYWVEVKLNAKNIGVLSIA
jgi:hypothetical protein